MKKKNEIKLEAQHPETAKYQNPRFSKEYVSATEKTTGFYINADGKGVITEPNIIRCLNPIYARVVEYLVEIGFFEIKQQNKTGGTT